MYVVVVLLCIHKKNFPSLNIPVVCVHGRREAKKGNGKTLVIFTMGNKLVFQFRQYYLVNFVMVEQSKQII